MKDQIYEENRPWGKYRRFTLNQPSTVKIITVDIGGTLSLQTHTKRAEFWCVIGGSGTVEVNGVVSQVKKGDEIYIETGMTHRASAETEPLEILEIATGEFDESDIHRLEDKYGR
jgi:mannose-6-phosphate isomerase-like protein (cupin superfamily)